MAIVQLRQSALSDRITSSPHDYDVMILDELSRPSTSYAKENQVIRRKKNGPSMVFTAVREQQDYGGKSCSREYCNRLT